MLLNPDVTQVPSKRWLVYLGFLNVGRVHQLFLRISPSLKSHVWVFIERWEVVQRWWGHQILVQLLM